MSNNSNESISDDSKTIFISLNEMDKTAAEEMAEKKQVLNGRFVLEDIIGIGGMGVVYRATDKIKQASGQKDYYVAIKVLSKEVRKHPESLLALQRETYKEQLLAHPNLLKVYDFNRDGDVVYKVMELVKGKHLKEIIKDINKDNTDINDKHIKHCFSIAYDIAVALEYAHKHNIIHSDLKPSNVFIDDKGIVKVFDFGIARSQKNTKIPAKDDDTSIFDPANFTAFTPKYASLEMLNNEPPYWSDDIYALGCILYELLTGHHPFDGQTAQDALEQHIKIPEIPSLPESYQDVINKCLALKRQGRFSHMKEVQQAIIQADENQQTPQTDNDRYQQSTNTVKQRKPRSYDNKKSKISYKQLQINKRQAQSLIEQCKNFFSLRNNYFIVSLTTLLAAISTYYLVMFTYSLYSTGSLSNSLNLRDLPSCQSLFTDHKHMQNGDICTISSVDGNPFIPMKVIKNKHQTFAIQPSPLSNTQAKIICQNSKRCEVDVTNNDDKHFEVQSIADIQPIIYSMQLYTDQSLKIPNKSQITSLLGVKTLDQLCGTQNVHNNNLLEVIQASGIYYVVGTTVRNQHCQPINQALTNNNMSANIRFVYQPVKELK